MPDITMCANDECRRRSECYRYMAAPNPWRQAYSEFKCGSEEIDHFIPLEPQQGE